MSPFSKKFLVVFGVSGLASFVLFSAQQARANTVITMPGRTCVISGSGTVCPIPGGSVISGPGGLSKVYFDFVSTGTNLLISSELYKQSFSGTLYSDSVSSNFSAGTHETSVTPQQVNLSISQWDYFFAGFVGASGSGMTTLTNIIGVGALTK